MILEKRKEEILENGDKIIYCSYKEAMELKIKYPNAIVELKDHIVKDKIYELDNLVCIIPEEFPKITEGLWDWDEYSNTPSGLKNHVFNGDTTFCEQYCGGGWDNEYFFINSLIETERNILSWDKITKGCYTALPLCIKTTVTIKKENE